MAANPLGLTSTAGAALVSIGVIVAAQIVVNVILGVLRPNGAGATFLLDTAITVAVMVPALSLLLART